MSTKRQRGPAWHYVIKRSGLLERPIYLSFTDEAEGDEYVRRLEALLDRGIVPDELKAAPKGVKLLRAHVRSYLADQHTAADDKENLRIALGRLPIKLELRELTFAWASAWVTRMKRVDNLAPSTIRHHVGALARCLDWVANNGDIPFNPLRSLPKGYSIYTPTDGAAAVALEGAAKADSERDRRLIATPGLDGRTEEQRIRAVLAGEKPEGKQRAPALPHRDHLVLMFDLALETAMRMREIYSLTWDQVDLERRTIFLDKTKNGSKRQVPLSSVAVAALQGAPGCAAAGGWIFPWWTGEPKLLKKVTSRLSRQFGRLFELAGCVDLNFHDLRHEATSRLFERTTLSDVKIAKITGHKSVRMLMRYANLRASNLAESLW